MDKPDPTNHGPALAGEERYAAGDHGRRAPHCQHLSAQLLDPGALRDSLHRNVLRESARFRKHQGFEINPRFQVVAIDPGRGELMLQAIALGRVAGPDDVVLTSKPSLVHLVSGLYATTQAAGPDFEDFIFDLSRQRIKYIILDESIVNKHPFIIPILDKHTDRFLPISDRKNPWAVVVEVKKPETLGP